MKFQARIFSDKIQHDWEIVDMQWLSPFDFDEAAFHFGQKQYDEDSDTFGRNGALKVEVKDENGTIKKFEVAVSLEPNFETWEI